MPDILTEFPEDESDPRTDREKELDEEDRLPSDFDSQAISDEEFDRFLASLNDG
jgi:hypothetical protein